MKTDKETLERKNLLSDYKKKNAETVELKWKAKQAEAESKRLQDQVNINKAEELRLALSSITIDCDKSIMGSEPMYKPTLNEYERDVVSHKLIEVIKRF